MNIANRTSIATERYSGTRLSDDSEGRIGKRPIVVLLAA